MKLRCRLLSPRSLVQLVKLVLWFLSSFYTKRWRNRTCNRSTPRWGSSDTSGSDYSKALRLDYINSMACIENFGIMMNEYDNVIFHEEQRNTCPHFQLIYCQSSSGKIIIFYQCFSLKKADNTSFENSDICYITLLEGSYSFMFIFCCRLINCTWKH